MDPQEEYWCKLSVMLYSPPPQKHSDERQLSWFAAVLIFNQSSVFCIQVFREKKGHD